MGVGRGEARVALPGNGASKEYWVKTRKWPAVFAVDAGLRMAARLEFFSFFHSSLFHLTQLPLSLRDSRYQLKTVLKYC